MLTHCPAGSPCRTSEISTILKTAPLYVSFFFFFFFLLPSLRVRRYHMGRVLYSRLLIYRGSAGWSWFSFRCPRYRWVAICSTILQTSPPGGGGGLQYHWQFPLARVPNDCCRTSEKMDRGVKTHIDQMMEYRVKEGWKPFILFGHAKRACSYVPLVLACIRQSQPGSHRSESAGIMTSRMLVIPGVYSSSYSSG